ncbi:MAG: UDP-N-acetylglucosamine 1-carboxyvinyltransferase [Clostridia bacterium]|nr:UDP-N-acetylglucosamine 1-carboxyvinyltransferase [Clostridia bacterium]
MDRLLINGGHRLEGELAVHSAKNCVLALLAACVMATRPVTLFNCPKITDILNMTKIIEALGGKIYWEKDDLTVDCSVLTGNEIPSSYAKEIRSSLFLMGPIIGRLKHAKAAFPGGCDIGIRPIDLHLKGLRALNIDIEETGGFLYCNGENAEGNDIHLDFPSVGATENIMMAAVLAKGRTIITNAAKEPEITALQNFLNKMGAKIFGAGSSTIIIEGVKKLEGCEFEPIPDRIVAGTYIIAAAITGGKLLVSNCVPDDITALLSKLEGCVSRLSNGEKSVYIECSKRPDAISLIETSPYPGFPTDLQAQILALETVSSGTSVIVENIFETRYKHVSELTKMGADITVRDRLALVRGVNRLKSAEVNAYDLRGGAALVLAGLNAEGVTVVNNAKHIDRGYFMLDKALNSVGADIRRI